MGSVEDMLRDRKKSIDNIVAPDELEERLRGTLNKRNKKKRSKKIIASFIVCAFLIGYSYDAVAYYGKKILGYDDVTFGNLAKLNELGRGQEINKSCVFSNGIKVTLDGIFFDSNKLVALFKIEGKDIDKAGGIPHYDLNGILNCHAHSGNGRYLDKNTLVFLQEFESPAFFEKWMTMRIDIITKNINETREIKFVLNRNKAMHQVVKQNIDEKLEIEGIPVSFEKISASPLTIEVDGKIDKSFAGEMGISNKRIDFDLYINDKSYEHQGGGMGYSGGDITFNNNFDGVSEDIKSIEIKNIRLVDYDMADKLIDVNYDTKDLMVDLGKTSILIKDISFDGEFTYIKAQMDKKVEVPLGLLIGNESLEFIEVESKDVDNLSEKVYKFKGKGEGMKLGIKAVEFIKGSDSVIDIPVK